MIRGIAAQLAWALRVDARSVHSHLLRLFFVGTMFMSVFFAWASSAGAPGLDLFKNMCWMNLAIILMGCIFYFSTTVTEEKEADSLSLLKLAGLGPLTVLLGKFLSRLVSAFMLLSVQLPFIFLAITLGGVTFHQIVAAYMSLAAFLCVVATISLICSIRCSSSSSASAASALTVIICLFVLPLVVNQMSASPAIPKRILDSIKSLDSGLQKVDMYGSLLRINKTGFAESSFSPQVIFHLLIAVLLMFVAWLIFDRSTSGLHGPERQFGLLNRSSRFKFLSVPRVTDKPFFWKDFYFLTGGKLWFVIRLVAFALITIVLLFVFQNSTQKAARNLLFTMLGFVVLESSIYTARIFYDELRWRSLPSLLLTPNSTIVIGTEKVLGCAIALIPACIFMGVAFLIDAPEVLYFVANPAFWFVLILFVTFLHLGALLSLHIRWGALPLAFVITILMTSCCPVMSTGLVLSATMSEKSTFFAMLGTMLGFAVYWLVVLFPIQCEIAARLRKVAGK